MPKLTMSLINATKPGKKEIVVRDTEVAGFALRVTPSGAKSFFVRYRLGRGRDAAIRQPTICAVGPNSLEQARATAREWKAKGKEGIDMVQAQHDEATAPTVKRMCDAYLVKHAVKKRSGAEDKRRIGKLPDRFLKMRLKDVKHIDIESLHSSMTVSPYEANRVLALLSKMFSLAIKWEWVETSPTLHIEKFPEEKRERFLSKEELKRLSYVLDDYAIGSTDHQVAADAIRLLVLTGARKSEVLRAEWSQFDLDEAVWTKPSSHTKTKKAHRVPLSGPATALLQAIRAGQSEGCLYVCPGRHGGHRGDLKSAWEEIRVAAEIKDVRMHDLRHTYASLLVSAGVSLPIIGRLLGHTQSRTTERYAHLADDPLRDATAIVGNVIESGRKR